MADFKTALRWIKTTRSKELCDAFHGCVKRRAAEQDSIIAKLRCIDAGDPRLQKALAIVGDLGDDSFGRLTSFSELRRIVNQRATTSDMVCFVLTHMFLLRLML